MATVEEKMDKLADDVLKIGVEQVKGFSKLDHLNSWSITAEKTTIELRESISDLTSRMTALEAMFTKALPKVSPREEEGRANGHDVHISQQGQESKGRTLDSTLLKGTLHFPKSTCPVFGDPESSRKPTFTAYDIPDTHGSKDAFHPNHENKEPKIPRLDCPRFNGDHPRVWKEKCEKFFTLFRVPIHLWAPYATINFDDNAALWLKTYEAQHNVDSWPDLCIAVDQKFGRDLYQNYMRELLAIKQSSDVLEYANLFEQANRFEQAKHKVLRHNRNLDEVFLVQKFLDGLQYSISSAIMLHKPRTVDTTLSLALMQEEMLEASAKRYLKRSSRYSPRLNSNTKPIALLDAPPSEAKTVGTPDPKPKWESKLSTLHEQRRAQGLCMKCGEKWGGGHRCPKKVPLHILEEVWDVFNLEEEPTRPSDSVSNSSDEEILALSAEAIIGVQGKKTMKLQCMINNTNILILVDSGSTSTFISTNMANKLNYDQEEVPAVQV
jgi:hypothetical protein